MLSYLIILGIFANLCQASQGNINYDNYKVYRVIPQTVEHVKLLLDLESSGTVFWKGPSGIGKQSDILFSPSDQSSEKYNKLKKSGIKINTLINDVGKLIKNETIFQGVPTGKLAWDQYYRLSDINMFLDDLAVSYPDITSVFSIGNTSEGRELKVIKISKSNDTKPCIFIDANIHAREWITSAVATYLINDLYYSSDESIISWTEEFDWYILPVVNPDGFEYSHTTDRMWRKSRSNSTSPLGCRGADLNRNFDYNWLGGGSSTNPCVETYAGSAAFAEPETLAIANFIDTIATNLRLYLSLHSYSQFIMFPYGDTANHSEYNNFMEVGKEAASALRERYNTTFKAGNWLEILYLSTGTSMDWVYNKHKVNISLTYELRDEGAYGFLLPADQIEPSAVEFIDSLFPIIERLQNIILLENEVQDLPYFELPTLDY